MTTLTDTDFLYSVNKTLQTSPDSTQRDIAAKSGMSLGMTNSVLKRFAKKGWIMAKKVNPRTIRYVLTAEGIKALEERTKSYMARTFRNIRGCTDRIERTVAAAKANGCTGVVLYGESDIAFLVEYACSKYGIGCRNEKIVPAAIPQTEHILLLAGEQAGREEAELLREAGAKAVWEE
jgi:DNA-binding MarR family transcriptional regulator